MNIYINDARYTINNFEEINTIVPPEEIIKLSFIHLEITELPENMFRYNTNLEYLNLNYCSLTTLPENIFENNTNLQELYLYMNNIKNLPENIFKNNTNLTKLQLGVNMLTELPVKIFRYNTKLNILRLDDNMLTHLPENIFRYNTNLKNVYLQSNKLTNLMSEDILKTLFRYNTNLREIRLDTNELTHLPEDMFRYNTNLHILSLGGNKLKVLPENIFQYNTNLTELYLDFNEFEKLPDNIFRYNTELLDLDLSNNMLTQLPISLLNCNRLKNVVYDDNEINYIPPNMQRFLNRLRNQSNNLQIYNDGQNVHNHEIQESIMNSINNILSIPKTIARDKIMDLILESKLSDTSKRLLFEYCNDNAVHTVLNVTFEEVLQHMFQYIVDKLPDKLDDIVQILDTEMQESECKCFTGRISRLINCLAGISDLVEVKIPENMERSNIVLMLRNKYSDQELIDNIVKEFTERGYQEYIEEYIDAL